MSNIKKTIGESPLRGTPKQKINLIIGDGKIKSRHIGNKQVTLEKLADEVMEEFQERISSHEETGIYVSNSFGTSTGVAISQKTITDKFNEVDAAIASIGSNSGGHNILPFDGFLTVPVSNVSSEKYTYHRTISPGQIIISPLKYTIVANNTLNSPNKFYLKVEGTDGEEDTYYSKWEITTDVYGNPSPGDPFTTLEPGVVSKSEWYYREYRINKLFYNRSNKVVYAYEYSTTSLTPITNIQVVETNAPEDESTLNPDHATKGSIVVDLEHDKLLTWDGNKWKALSGGGSTSDDVPNHLSVRNGKLYLEIVSTGSEPVVLSEVDLPTGGDSFPDKEYVPADFSGLGRKTLAKNLSNDENVLTANMLSSANTEYYIQYDYDLKGATVTLPANITLIFIGGSIKNGTLVGNNTRIQAKKGTVIFYDVIIEGTWDVEHAWSSWFNCSKDGYKIIDIGKGEQIETNIELSLGGACNIYSRTNEFFTGDGSNSVYIAPVGDSKMLHIRGISTNRNYGITFFNSNTVFDETTLIAGGISSNNVIYDVEVEVPEGSTYICMPIKNGATDFFVKSISYENIDDAHTWYVIEKNDGTTEKLPYSTAPSGITFNDDTVKLQSLIDLNAHHTTIEEGVYMINAHRTDIGGGKYGGLIFHEKFGKTLEINGVLKHDSTHNDVERYLLVVQSTRNCNIIGNGELQGDMCEDPSARADGEGPGTGLLIADCVDLTVKGIAAKYNSCDGIIARYKWGLTDTVKEQKRHKLEFVTMSYNHRDGLVYENGDDVTVENCIFEGNGTIKGTNDKAAVDVEPFRYSPSQEVYRRYCDNFIFRHNRFYHTQVGLKLERCLNTVVCDNIFQNGMDIEYKRYDYNIYPDCYGIAIVLYDSGLAGWDDYGELIISANQKWLNSRVHIYNNKAENFYNFVHAINGGRPNSFEAYDNLIVNSALNNTSAGYSYVFRMECCSNTRVHHNKILSSLGIALIDGRSDFFSFAKNIEVDNNLLVLGYPQNKDMESSTAVSPFRVISPDIMDYTIHDNIIESPLDYDRNLLLGSGKFGRGYTEFVQLYAFESKFPVLNGKNTFKGKNIFRSTNVGTAENIITEDSWQAAAGAKFISNEYEQEGIVLQNWKKAYFDKTFEDNLQVNAGEWVKFPTLQNRVWLCCNSGTLGSVSDLPTSKWKYSFISGDVRLSCPTDSVGGNTPIINWISRGICTEDNRPTTLNSAGRKMHETDTGKDITYNGSAWVYDEDKLSSDINAQITSEVPTMITSGINTQVPQMISAVITDVESISVANIENNTISVENNKYYTFNGPVNTLTVVLPTIDASNTKVHNITMFINTGSSASIQFTTEDAQESNPTPVYYSSGYNLDVSKTYEIKASYNNIGWVVSAEEIVSNVTPANNE